LVYYGQIVGNGDGGGGGGQHYGDDVDNNSPLSFGGRGFNSGGKEFQNPLLSMKHQDGGFNRSRKEFVLFQNPLLSMEDQNPWYPEVDNREGGWADSRADNGPGGGLEEATAELQAVMRDIGI
jgi:hypothetical protein